MIAAPLAGVGLTIDGRDVDGHHHIGVINPATGSVFAQAPAAGVQQLEQAVASAQAAFPAWSTRPWAERRALLQRFADVLREHAGAIGQTLMQEQGKPLARAIGEVNGAAVFTDALSNITIEPETLREGEGARVELVRRPLGPTLCITAWNFPLMLAVWKIVPALLAGNTVVLKPSPCTPLSTLKLGAAARDVFPPGVLNVVVCSDDNAPMLTQHPLIRKISFTGSTRTGQTIAAVAARNGLKRVTLELGGNDAAIVLEDVEPGAIASDLFWAKFHNSGQLCAAAKRLYVHAARYDEVCEALVRVAEGVIVGPGDDPATQLGPLQSARQVELMDGLVDDALARGATILWQGARHEGPGFYFPVTLLTNVPPGARVIREEAFGPVLPIVEVNDAEEGLRLANDSLYGLGGSVWSNDLDRARRVALRLDVGTSWINQHPAVAPDVPFGGAKLSGVGVEFSRRGLEEFTQLQVLSSKVFVAN